MSTRHRLIGLTVVVLWGLNFIAIHAGLEHFPPFFFAALRFAVMAVPVILFVPFPNVPVRWLLLYGAGFGIVQFAFLFLALATGMPTGLASLVLQSSAPFTVILGVVLLGERMTLRQVVGIGVAIVGMVVIGIDRAEAGAGIGVLPMLLTLIAGLGWAFGNLGSRLAKPDNPMRLTLWMCVIPPIPLYLMSLVIEGPSAGVDALSTAFTHEGLIALGGLAYVIVLGTVAGSGLWTYLMSKHPASTVAPFSLLVPVVGITASWLVLGENPSALQLIGAAVVIIGCLGGMMGAAGRAVPVTDSSACPTPPRNAGRASRFVPGRRSRRPQELAGPPREPVAAKAP
ncbi:EamA family transporter [Williamsia herbipolensis]|uniref:EamA family transporter n=1 Tax=Williamsia herbipolensis TaxID=1603258 RepID=UPI000ACB50D9|nr:EamA family transporter [Williamsia herbipolensis]